MRRILALAWMAIAGLTLPAGAPGGVVSGRVTMPEVCTPEVSPAVVVLEPKGAARPSPAAGEPSEVTLINQRGLQFVPRVRAIRLGQTLRFANGDTETHNVHILSPGNDFNATMAPGQPRDFTPVTAGVVRLGCDVHSHMRGYVVVADSPFVRVCSAQGKFRLDGVPDGDYTLAVWHEMGESLRKSVTVAGGHDLDLGTLTLAGPTAMPLAAGQAEPVRPWADVIDRVGLMLASAFDCAAKPGGFKKARKLAEDAYFAEFEASDMETAVRTHLGLARSSELERHFRDVAKVTRGVSEGQLSAARGVDSTRALLLALVKAADDLNRKGVTDGSRLRGPNALAVTAPTEALSPDRADRAAQLTALKAGFGRVAALADRGDADEATSAMTTVYFDEFEPLERFVAVRRLQDVHPLEERFNALRGSIETGLKGEPLAARLASLEVEVKLALERSDATGSGTFASAFVASLVTIVREGVEVILLLTMLLALVAKAGQAGARRAIAWGVGLALVASGATAAALNLMVASAQGRSRELLEGGVMLAAAGVLFYVSYWLISQSESKRWMSFLKRQASKGSALGAKGFFALLATSFLAVYREGAETALMYQALIGSQNGSGAGLTGLAGGLGVGIVVLAGVAYAIRATSVKLPLRAFFQATGALLFAMAVVFAGNGVFELQSSGALKVTPFDWVGNGLPWLGVYPNVQALSVQGLLLAGAVLAVVVMLSEARGVKATKGPGLGLSTQVKPPAGVGV